MKNLVSAILSVSPLLASHVGALVLGQSAAASPRSLNLTQLNVAAKSAIGSLTRMPAWTTGWDWDQGTGLYGIWKHYEATKDAQSLEELETWFDRALPRGVRKHVNSMAAITALVETYNITRNPSYLPVIEDWGYWAMYNLTRTPDGGWHLTTEPHDGEMWIDTLMMAALPLAKIGVLTNKPEYKTEAIFQFRNHVKWIFDSPNNLYFHAYTFNDKNNFGAIHWARGNAWGLIAAVELPDYLGLPPTDPDAIYFRSILTRQLAALADLQDPSGLWRTVLDKPISDGSYLETSAAAGFAFSYLKAQRLGYIGAEYQPLAYKSLQAVLSQIAPDGLVRNVSAGTGVGEDAQHYYDISRIQTMWGQSLAISALSEALQLYSEDC
ncbi:hypothetical protein INS49_000693 [Diaporthe citri]|uniref:uncharacterized protein n=1 Tax=Diaporthe citri TaxID=83186 RepID=UPI001C808DE8|nr:uncharacterized protein INS49_000693 [Diaporthe citri]KAG6366516.1 hypothetical protein INS49_000693 [Diaporthe citri]